MRVLILGGTGMLGHKLWQRLNEKFETYVTIRSTYSGVSINGLFDRERTLERVDVFRFDSITNAISLLHPDVVINCIGIVKQLEEATDPLISLTVNSLFPHKLATLCRAANARLIHISTDCVFSGKRGGYLESDVPDAQDLYGRTKLLGELDDIHCLTLRTSIIGRELSSTTGLVEWFLSQNMRQVLGYSRAMFSGLTTIALADIIIELIQHFQDLSGLYHVSAKPITKHDLLSLVRDAYKVQIEIKPDDRVAIDRSLDSSRFWAIVKSRPPSWAEMIAEMAADPTPYDVWREKCC